jgi:hypothetical protein
MIQPVSRARDRAKESEDHVPIRPPRKDAVIHELVGHGGIAVGEVEKI